MMLCVEGRHQSVFGLIGQNKREGVPERYEGKGVRFTTGKISLSPGKHLKKMVTSTLPSFA